MFKVLIIEDEAAIRSGLIKAVNWQQIECVVCGEADSGLSGLEKYLETNPDIIITDIVMPGIDGITFLKYVKNKSSNVKVILITGYRDFEYAREAVNLGASILLTKPINFDQFMDVLKNLVLQLKQEINYSGKNLEPQKKLELILQEREQFLLEFIKGKVFTPSILKEQTIKFGLEYSSYSVATVELDKSEDVLEDSVRLRNITHDLFSLIKELFKGDDYNIPINVDNKYVAIILGFKIKDSSNHDDAVNYIASLQKRIKDSFSYNISFGISRIYEDSNRLQECYSESLSALEQSFFAGENSINCFKSGVSNFSNFECGSYLNCHQEIINLVKCHNGVQLTKKLNNLFEDIILEVPRDINVIKSTVICILVLTLKSIYSGDTKNFEKILLKYYSFKKIINACYLYKIKDIFIAVVLDSFDYILKKKESNKITVIKLITEYLQENYFKNITLNEVADYVYFSPSYISSLVKSETGKSFIDILNGIRIEKAKYMFMNTELKSYEIAEKVGINDPHYFSQVFKKITGKTTTEFIELHKTR